MKSYLNHIAILTGSIEKTLAETKHPIELIGPAEEFLSEGTREVYIGKESQMGRLLLMEPIGKGPYQDAITKRGGGLHHIALDVMDIDLYINQISGSGWLLHPKSIEYYKSNRQVYLCRPKNNVIMEIKEREQEPKNIEFYINKVEFPFFKESMANILCCDQLVYGSEAKMVSKSGEVYANP